MIGLLSPQNFSSPYKAVNPSDFWRRWHMSLSSWLRDYLFIPLGGSRSTTLMTVRNLLVTFLLAGLWHDPAWTFVFWGLLWGVFQSVHLLAHNRGLTLSWVWLNRALTLLAAVIAWVFFRAHSMRTAVDVLAAMLGLDDVRDESLLRLTPALVALILFGLLWVNFLPNSWQVEPRPKARYALALGLLAGCSLLTLTRPSPFLYLQF